MPSKTRSLIDTLFLNHAGKAYDRETAIGPFRVIADAMDVFHKTNQALKTDRTLTPFGKDTARAAAASTARAAIATFRDGRVPNLDTDIRLKRAAITKPTQVDQSTAASLRNELLKLSPIEIRVAYASANDVEKQQIESAALSFGRRPVKGENGITWETLLPQEVLDEAQAARLAKNFPAETQQLVELQELRDTTISASQFAENELKETLLDEAASLSTSVR